MAKIRISDITIDKVGGLEHGAIVVCTKTTSNLTKNKQYVLIKFDSGLRARWYVRNDLGYLCSDFKFFVFLKDWREKQLKDLGI